ncbi:hypothetical protein C0Z18_10130 [Trinickia dabaoshanensis]|uniref:Lysozyme inhibitor LprI-like N-terminal domain-containing protein n=1 Tax=Trinickia dabaoshanensis TaxID=564714 RepID=A0A2N7VUR0_9BURK|nr:lysozyme inhibitor LprI family protein [Trinickia dabaoshanensis]PMS20877.1 hypothetical protein C0Z18_10130 [Trinickia dabaoshanensis]
MKKLVLAVVVLASTRVFADQTPADEIAAHSGLPASEVNALLADCESNQTSMNFCAWRDRIVAERELQRVVDSRDSEHPDGKAVLDERIARWKKARDTACEQSARKEWGDGSMRPTAQTICVTAATKAMVKKLSATPGHKPH